MAFKRSAVRSRLSPPTRESEKRLETWFNSDKELITYQLLADGIRGAYGQIPSDF